MKKSTLALSVAAALAGLGFVSNAMATSQITGATAASTLVVNPDGIGHQLVFPYFTAQGDNATLLSLTNTDLTNGKVVKVRFRGAANSDDLYDFTLLLSPGDVWTASVSKDTATGLAKLVSTDTSCVLPSSANNATFSNGRTDPQAADKPNQTREGYVEVITMADVPPNAGAAAGVDSLFEALKHVNNVAPCTATVLDTALGNDVSAQVAVVGNAAPVGTLNNAADLRGMSAPTGGLTGDWVILNQVNTAAWSGVATALEVRAAGVRTAGNLVFWPQKFGTPQAVTTHATVALPGAPGAALAVAALANATADALLTNNVIAAQNYDLPDMSTPYAIPGAATVDLNASARADATTALLAVKSLKHQYVTNASIGAVTDVVFAQPTRRYSVGVNYAATAATVNTITTTGTLAAAVYRGLPTVGAGNNNGTNATYYVSGANSGIYSRQVCLDTINAPGLVAGQTSGLFNREETTPTTGSTSFVISPNVPSAATVLLICGEASVVSINQGGTTSPSSALTGSVARSDVTFATGFTDGWATWNVTTATTLGLPILGNTFMRARNGTVNYGFAFGAKVTR